MTLPFFLLSAGEATSGAAHPVLAYPLQKRHGATGDLVQRRATKIRKGLEPLAYEDGLPTTTVL